MSVVEEVTGKIGSKNWVLNPGAWQRQVDAL